MQHVDIAIIGGGMVGLALASALKNSRLSVLVVDAQFPLKPLTEQPELRVSAINQASENLLRRLHVWPAIQAARLQAYGHMHVWEQDSFAAIEFDHQMLHQGHLGHIIENQVVVNALWESLLDADNVQLLAPVSVQSWQRQDDGVELQLADGNTYRVGLLVGADGANSRIRQQAGLPISFADYQHKAIVATVQTELPHGACARQIFTADGPLAFLPLYEENLCSIVWSATTCEADRLMTLDEQAFSHALTSAFDARLGVCQVHSKRLAFPLTMRYARRWLDERLVLVGDAAHTIHPLAGQGANLGLMDAAALAERLLKLKSDNKDIGLLANLRPYERWRKAEAVRMLAAMGGFKTLFSGAHPLKKLMRGAGMSAINHLPLLKQQAMAMAAGLAGDTPNLAKPLI
ncbi:FAD-dependent monooxygenase [Bowmanella yangjiangensis]|uniref:FAD-dependent monooxygenase n=1 Tax=Bowmanella yangjiangensis TaxID=2811230 RepID=A0ABS3CR10_9ALTE|nr:FAD-dependent monooxygenase [Bowmanella yangjiangensis]MBN7819544.1 FAD-dependent monooxygenase [Bowmanella yangjiangensis]